MIKSAVEDGRLVISLCGRIDAENAAGEEADIAAAAAGHPGLPITLDAAELTYISSAGLRVILGLARSAPGKLPVRNVSPAVWDILNVTGFTQILDVRRGLREISVEGCPVIGQGAVGTVYRLDQDTIVKVFRGPDCLPAIEKEQARAKQALIRGIPTAISYDVVRVGGRYGSVFEMVRAENCNDIIVREPGRTEEILRQYTGLLKTVHGVTFPRGELPDARDIYRGYADCIAPLLPAGASSSLRELLAAMPENDHAVHGDVQMKNVMLTEAGPLLIDMETLCVGDPVFDFAGLWTAYLAFNEDEPDNTVRFLGLDAAACRHIYKRILEIYLGTADGEALRRAEDRIALLGCVRFMYLLTVSGMGKPELKDVRVRRTAERLGALLARAEGLTL